MKKQIAVILSVLLLASFAFAEDAKVMPQGVGRFYLAPTYSFATGTYGDTESGTTGFPETIQVFNLGLVLEYGITSWISGAIQWAPGWTPMSNIDGATRVNGSNTNDVADLFVGAKIQIIGPNAPVNSEGFRLALAPGVIIPMGGTDFSKELGSNNPTLSNMDRHVWGFGARFFFDWIFSDNFFLNFYNESIFYLSKQDLKYHSPIFSGIQAGAPNPGMFDHVTGEVDYKYRLTFEIEPVYTASLADGITFSAGLPFNYRLMPDFGYSFDSPNPALTNAFRTAFESRELIDDQHFFTIKPQVTFFITRTPLPLEFKLQYSVPVWGQNHQIRHDITLQCRAYFAIPALQNR